MLKCMRYGTAIIGTTEARILGEKREGRIGAGRAGGGGRGRGGQAGIFIGRAPRPLHWETQARGNRPSQAASWLVS